MDVVEFLKEQDRMCEQFNLCVDCPVYKENNGHNMPCGDFMNKYPEEFVPIVEKWSKEHPEKTRQSELLNIFPNARLDEEVISICPKAVDGEFKSGEICWSMSCHQCRKEYWLAEVK